MAGTTEMKLAAIQLPGFIFQLTIIRVMLNFVYCILSCIHSLLLASNCIYRVSLQKTENRKTWSPRNHCPVWSVPLTGYALWASVGQGGCQPLRVLLLQLWNYTSIGNLLSCLLCWLQLLINNNFNIFKTQCWWWTSHLPNHFLLNYCPHRILYWFQIYNTVVQLFTCTTKSSHLYCGYIQFRY